MIRWGEPVLSAILAGAFLSLLTLIWIAPILGVGRWAQTYRLAPPAPPVDRPKRVSICVPARDEAGRIGPCVRAALASDWPDLEVVVVDDGATRELAEARAVGTIRARG